MPRRRPVLPGSSCGKAAPSHADPSKQTRSHCTKDDSAFLLVGVYGPNHDDSQFYKALYARLDQWGDLFAVTFGSGMRHSRVSGLQQTA
ncbi:hypothetical protein NDU88_003614 [Pleurodeles waltl]|uniref:Uncharacterized protein n=1 Tax=Pleurodeles waltl TaxID=8319 RepID=A0AAV7MS48_PLEWA|nr:hypothetical protein NDU88_003614 [Pleurodeles waltl]